MRGPYSEYAAPPIYVYPDRPKPGVHFSRTELVQLGVAVFALSAAFTKEQNGRVSAAGPVSNLVIASVLFAGFLAMMPRASSFGGALVVLYLIQAASVNAFLAGFNMIPVMPLDGAKVWAWNKAVYLGLVAIALALIYVSVFRPY